MRPEVPLAQRNGPSLGPWVQNSVRCRAVCRALTTLFSNSARPSAPQVLPAPQECQGSR